MEKIKILMDVDTGIDDAIAICLALGNEKIELLGLTTAYGNRKLEDTTRNTLQILELIGKTDIPVAVGAEKPLVTKFNPPQASVVHGEDGLGDVSPKLPMPTIKPINKSAVEFMADTLRNSNEPITLVQVAPFTNVATLLMAHPELKPKIEKVVIMGGSTYKGNATPVAEANIIKDPEAAYILFNSGVKILMAGLDATWQANIKFSEIDEYKANGNWLSDKILSMCGIYEEHYKYRMKKEGIAMHDSVALAWLINPELIDAQDFNVSVDINGRYTYGLTVVDREDVLKLPKNATVALNLDREKVIQLIKDAIEKLSKEKV